MTMFTLPECKVIFLHPSYNAPYLSAETIFLDHMKLQRHIHAMDALRHLLTTAQGKW